jgi:hypothetical protein
MQPDGERIASLEEWRENHAAESKSRYDELTHLVRDVRTDIAEHRKEMLATAQRNHSRMDTHARAAVVGGFGLAVSIIGWLATALWGTKS